MYAISRPSVANKRYTRFHGDIDGFVVAPRQMASDGTAAIHTLSPVEIHRNDSEAVSESTGSISTRFKQVDAEFDCVSFTRFVSRLECVKGNWKLLTLEAIYERDHTMEVIPSACPAISLPQVPRNSYRSTSLVLSQKGFSIKQHLPENDRSESCNERVAERFKLLGA